jgi:large subunit ribosomal protein L25
MEQLTLNADLRTETGSAAARRFRRTGSVPAVIYGHKEGPVPVLLTLADAQNIVAHRIKMASLTAGHKTDQVLVKDVQFDVFGKEILHMDFERVAMDELIEVECPIELTGTAKGVAAGGVLEHPTSDVHVRCLPGNIPEFIKVSTSDLAIGDSVQVKDITPPEGVEILTDPEAFLVTIRPPLKAEEPEADEEAEPGPDEPEVIGRKKDDEEAEEADA